MVNGEVVKWGLYGERFLKRYVHRLLLSRLIDIEWNKIKMKISFLQHLITGSLKKQIRLFYPKNGKLLKLGKFIYAFLLWRRVNSVLSFRYSRLLLHKLTIKIVCVDAGISIVEYFFIFSKTTSLCVNGSCGKNFRQFYLISSLLFIFGISNF